MWYPLLKRLTFVIVSSYLRMIFLVLLCDFNAQFSQMHQLIKSNFRVGQIILIFRKVVI